MTRVDDEPELALTVRLAHRSETSPTSSSLARSTTAALSQSPSERRAAPATFRSSNSRVSSRLRTSW
jgi:hypothetical protein